jgi:hypothetical protein
LKNENKKIYQKIIKFKNVFRLFEDYGIDNIEIKFIEIYDGHDILDLKKRVQKLLKTIIMNR